jgi:predicted phosphodiesterase
MRTAVISDIHGNLEAFTEVLADIEPRRVDRILSLGDNVGYGPDPERVLGILREKGIPSIMGNHELGIVDRSFTGWFNPLARRSLEITRRLLLPSSIEFLEALKASLSTNGALFVHGCPPDSITSYLNEEPDDLLGDLFHDLDEKICFVGHTHVPAMVVFDGWKVRHEPLFEGEFELPEGYKCIVNVGSVGQPRDGDNRAKYVIWDDSRKSLDLRCISYDIERTVRKILELGFPRINADRLW